MLSCEDCKNRAIAKSQKLRQVDGESARDFIQEFLIILEYGIDFTLDCTGRI